MTVLGRPTFLLTEHAEAAYRSSIMRQEVFCRREAWYRLQMKLAIADRQISEGKMVEHDDVMDRLEAGINHS